MSIKMNDQYTNKLLEISAEYDEAFRNTSILITGATGLIGGALLKAFVIMQEKFNVPIELFVLVRNPARVPDSSFYSVIQGDAQTVNLTGYNFNYVFHSAGISSPDLYMTKPVDTVETNVLGTSNILKQIVDMDLRRFLFVSTGEVYGKIDGEGLIDEESLGLLQFDTIRSSYSESKRMTENLTIAYAAQYQVPVNIARLSHVLGPHFTEKDKRISADFFRTAWRKDNIVLKSSGETLRTYIFVTDVVSAFFHIVLNGKENEIFNVTNSDNTVSIKKLAQYIAELNEVEVMFDTPSTIELKAQAPMKRATLEDRKLRSIGWSPKTSLFEGLKLVNNR